MTGLLHRLAARAQGSPSGIRPAARLPFAPAPALLDDVAGANGPPAVPRAGPARRPAAPDAAAALPPAGDPGPTRAHATAPGPLDGVAGPRAARPQNRPGGHPDDLAAGRPSPGEPGHPPPPPALRRPYRPEPRPETLERRWAHGEPGAAPDPAGADAAAPPAALTRPPQAARPLRGQAPRPPAPLLPERPAPAPPAPAPLATAAGFSGVAGLGGPPAAPVEEITEVHVRIGRVDIVAPARPPDPSHRPSAERRSMSLDDYLARRRGVR